MKVVIFNSGLGNRMGEFTKHNHKSMAVLKNGETIFHRQLRLLSAEGIKDFIITTGPFEEQLKKCGVEYFDFYMFHNVCELNIDAYLDEKYGIYDYLMEQKRKGRIRHLGFSTHGTLDTMKRFLDAYGKDMEFCQIQLNWLDWKMQNAKAKVELLNALNIPIWVMEPVRGGKLVSIGAEYEASLKALRPNASVVEWAFRFLQSIPTVAVKPFGIFTSLML